jgi:hypothetical protein
VGFVGILVVRPQSGPGLSTDRSVVVWWEKGGSMGEVLSILVCVCVCVFIFWLLECGCCVMASAAQLLSRRRASASERRRRAIDKTQTNPLKIYQRT